MKKVAILASGNMMPGHDKRRDDGFELDEQMGKLVPAFADQGMTLFLELWNTAASVAQDYDAMLPLIVWDYFEGNEDAFLAEMASVESKTKLFNSFDVLKWNAHKSYLSELQSRGARTIQTISVDKVTPTRIERAFAAFDCNTIVIKPNVGGGAWRQVLHPKGAPLPASSDLPPDGALIQPFLPSVIEEGECTFLYFGGKFSHALIKRPKIGDYRVQSIYGGTEERYIPTKSERNTARHIIDMLDFTPVYARVDFIRGLDGGLKLIELEMVEPYLYLPFADGEGGENSGAKMLAGTVAKRIGA